MKDFVFYLVILLLAVIVLTVVLYYDIKHTYRDEDLWKK